MKAKERLLGGKKGGGQGGIRKGNTGDEYDQGTLHKCMEMSS